MKITVVGSGFVGQTTAMRILEKGLGEVVLIEPKTTLNTGNVRNERTVDELERI